MRVTLDRLRRKAEFEAHRAALARNANVKHLDVTRRGDGLLTIRIDPEAAARLVGREIFGPAQPVRVLLEDRIAEAWHSAECPPEAA